MTYCFEHGIGAVSFLSHYCLKSRNYFSHFTGKETETQKSHLDCDSPKEMN